MATIAEMFVEIGADASDFDKETKKMQNSMKGMQDDMRSMGDAMGKSTREMGNDWKYMSQEMKDAFKQSKAQMMPFKKDLMDVEFQFFKMAQGMKTYKGTNAEFMGDLEAMGKKQKKITDNMMKQNDLMKTGFIQGVAAMMAKSGQSEKIAANFERMGNPLYKVNNGLLKVTGGIEKIAMRAGPASLALEMLGPKANMKELNDMTMMISQGIMRIGAVSLVAAAASVVLYGALHKGAMDSVKGYKEAFNGMLSAVRQAFQPMVDVFGAVMIKVYEFITAIANLVIKFNEAHPVIAKVVQGFLMLIPALMLILSPLAAGIGLFMGMKAALGAVWMLIGPLVTGLGAMLGTVLLVAAGIAIFGVAIWALWTKVDGFKEGVLAAWEAIKTGAQIAFAAILAFIQPAIDAIVAFVMAKWTEIKTFFDTNGAQILAAATNVWNFIATVIGGVMMGVWAVMQFIWPAVKALIVSTWQAIQNVINGAINIILGIIKVFSALFTGDWKGVWEGIKQILLGAVQAIWGLINLWFVGKFIGGFKIFATAGKSLFKTFWAAVKSIFSTTFNAIKNSTTAIANGIKSSLTSIFNAVKSTINTILNGIKTLFTTIWNAIKSAVTGSVNGIKSAISTGLNAAKSTVSSILNSIKSAFTSAWNSIKSGATSGMKNVTSAIKSGVTAALNVVKSLGASFKAAGKGLVEMMAAGITAAAGKVINSMKSLASKARDFLPFSPAKTGPLSDLDKLDFGGPISDSLRKGTPTIQRLMDNMLTMPDIVPPSMLPTYTSDAMNSQKTAQTVIVELDGRTLARGTLPHMEREIRLKTGLRFN